MRRSKKGYKHYLSALESDVLIYNSPNVNTLKSHHTYFACIMTTEMLDNYSWFSHHYFLKILNRIVVEDALRSIS